MAVVGEMRKLTIGGNTYTITIPTKLSQFQNDSGYTTNIGTITSVKTTAGTHTTINTSSGAVSFNVPTTAAHVGINFGYTTSGNNRAVQQDNSGNLYVVQKDNNTTYSAGTGLSLSSTTFSVKLGYTTSGNNRAVQADDNGNLYIVQKDDNTTYSSKEAVSGGTEVSLVTTGEKYLWNSKTTNTGTVTSVAASGSGGISISGSPITSSGTIAIGLNLSTAINGLGEGTSAAQRDDYIVAQYAGGGTTTTTYHRRKLSNIFKALNASDITTALGYTPYNAANPNGYTTNTGTITKVTAGVGLNTTSNDTATDGGDITTTGTLYLTKSGASAGSYGDSGNQTPSYGSTFKVPYVTVDKYGRVTAISEHTVKIPASDNTNTTYSLSNALASHKFTETLTAGGSGSGTSTATMEFAAGTGISLQDDTTNKKLTIGNTGVTSITTAAGSHSIKSSATGAVSFNVPTKTSHLTNDSDYTTKTYVDTAIANLPEPMIFKGSLGTDGTITTLPAAAASNEGYTYKVITAGEYASQNAKVGDTFVSDGTNWILIPSGDEPSGTVTSITLKAGGGISLDTDNTAITTSGTRTISHKDTSSQESISASNRRYITAVTLDTYGHVTSLSTGTETVTDTTYSAGTGLSLSGTTFNVKLGYSTSGNNRAVQADDNGNLYVVQKDNNTTYSAGTGLSLSSTTFSVKLGYSTSGNNRAVQADESGNLYVVQKDDNTTYTFDGTYNSSTNKAATVSTVTNAIGALDGVISGTAGAGKTLTALSQTDGKVTATFGNISITKSQISDFPSSMTPSSHTHGNIQNDGTLQTTDVAVGNNDKLVITDSSDNSKIARTSVTFDGSTTNKALTPKGTWETFLQSHQSLSGYVPTSRTINDKALTDNITLSASDVGAATSNHTHTTTIASSSGANQLTLTANTKYAITAGGTSYVFTTPPNTWRGIQDNLTSTSTTDSLSAKQGKILNESKLSLTGGAVTGPVTFGDSVIIDEATIGDLTVNGNGSFTNNLQVNTINGVAVGNNPKFTDLNYYHTTGSWTGLTYTFGKAGGAPDLNFTLPITVSTSSPTSSDGNNGDLWFTYTA